MAPSGSHFKRSVGRPIKSLSDRAAKKRARALQRYYDQKAEKQLEQGVEKSGDLHSGRMEVWYTTVKDMNDHITEEMPTQDNQIVEVQESFVFTGGSY